MKLPVYTSLLSARMELRKHSPPGGTGPWQLSIWRPGTHCTYASCCLGMDLWSKQLHDGLRLTITQHVLFLSVCFLYFFRCCWIFCCFFSNYLSLFFVSLYFHPASLSTGGLFKKFAGISTANRTSPVRLKNTSDI